MSLDSILSHITKENDIERDKIIKAAQSQAREVVREAHKEAEAIYAQGLAKEKAACESQRQRLLAAVQLESKKKILQAKQELIGEVIAKLKPHLKKEKFKRKEIRFDAVKETAEALSFYLNKLRQDYESEIARMLFE
jgi:vacuolar-type H+-ATPase subunit E/Vma4